MKNRKEDFEKCGIYIIINKVNNKVYIGKSINIWRRIQSHIYALRNKTSKHENQHLIAAWHKYGELNFDYQVLEYFDKNDIDENFLKDRELFWIDKYNSIDENKGYNLRRDSSSKMITHSTTILKHKAKLGMKNPNFGKQWSDEKKLKMSLLKKDQYLKGIVVVNYEGLRKGINVRNQKLKNDPVYREKFGNNVSIATTRYKIEQYSKEGLYIKTWNSVKQIITENPTYKWQQIYNVCSGYKPSIYGYIWKKVSNNDIVQL